MTVVMIFVTFVTFLENSILEAISSFFAYC